MDHEIETDVEFDDFLVKMFWKLHRFRCLQWIVLLLIRLREKLDLHIFVKRPITKHVDEMDNCHFRTLFKPAFALDDNYTDPDFLCSMQLNTNVNYYSLGEAIQAATRVTLYMCPCTVYFIMYHHLGNGNISPEMAFFISFCCVVIGYVIYEMRQTQEKQWRTFTDAWNTVLNKASIATATDCKAVFCCGAFSYYLVPILRTLTLTMDIVSVHAVCAFMFGVHLMTNDYGLKVAGIVSKPLSMSSAIFSMICLSSRLQSDNHCLALLAFGGLLFIYYPEFSKLLWEWAPGPWIITAVGICSSCTVSAQLTLCIILMNFIVIFLSPVLYIYCVQYKLNILGPWDEATLNLNVNMEEIQKGFESRKKQPSNSSNPKNVWGESPDSKIAEMEAKGIGLVL